MAKSWADMSKEERKATGKSKQEYNKATGQGRHAEEKKPADTTTVNAKEVEKSSASDRHRQAMAKAQSYKDQKNEGYKKIDEYIQGGGQRSGKDYQNFLNQNNIKDSGYQDYANANRKAKYDANQQARKQEAAAYQQFNQDRAAFRKQSGTTGQRKVDQRAHYEHLQKTKGGYGGSQVHQNAVAALMGTGQKFSNLDVQREMGSSSTYNMKGLYKAYGGYENYKENHSVGSGNWQSRIPQSELGTMKEADDSQRQYFSNQNKMYEGMSGKYGNYDWFNKSRQRAKEQGQRFNQSFDARAERMANSNYGSVYGY